MRALVPLLLALTVGVAFAQAPAPLDQYGSRRLMMVRDQIEARGVKNPELLVVMRTVPRELFVPEGFRPQAYQINRCQLASARLFLNRSSLL